LLDWIVGALVPRIRGEFHVAADPASVGIGGSSMDGLAARDAHFGSREHFGLALAMSPSLWIGRGRIFEYVASRSKPWTSRIYLDGGALEAGGSLLTPVRKLAGHPGGRGG